MRWVGQGAFEVKASVAGVKDVELERLLHPWDLPGKSTGVGCHCLLQIMPYKASNGLFTFPSLHLYHVLANKLMYSIVHPLNPAVMTIYLFEA